MRSLFLITIPYRIPICKVFLGIITLREYWKIEGLSTRLAGSIHTRRGGSPTAINSSGATQSSSRLSTWNLQGLASPHAAKATAKVSPNPQAASRSYQRATSWQNQQEGSQTLLPAATPWPEETTSNRKGSPSEARQRGRPKCRKWYSERYPSDQE